ncbi:cytochrome b5 reductase 4 isoform X2 [Eupeodes corollae]|uniref:cytochrome b5 reductase 4 isoform X2 n=1 Tax=Eupeodes corollae TaxID=290404 RepID=UPI0024931D68|nr:cytochrome b5 reductase 4 isoform X2 [Eupeodes corollae]
MSEPKSTTLSLPSSTSLKLPPPVQKQSSGSATGNPRNKCALKPGHSLMDWIRLGNSGYDLSGTNGAIIPVSSKELSKHCSKEDAWMAIRGNVYNVTRYMDFHPGGPEELMRGVGTDATKIFDEVHAWVNYEQLLKKCLIGPLRNVVKIDTDLFKLPKMNLAPPEPVIPLQKIPPKVKPRFDWIQKQSDLTLYFYTKEFSNPGLLLKRNSLKNIEVKIGIDNCWNVHSFELHDEVLWPPTNTNISSESGKIEIHFTKTKTTIWPKYGTCNESIDQQLEDTYESEILQNQNFNNNSFVLVLGVKNDIIVLPPVGYHFAFNCDIEAGTGITPMLSIIDHLLARKKLRIEKLMLWFFNKTEEDMWCRNILEEMMKNDDRLKIVYVYSQLTEKSNPEDGHISKELLKNIKNPLSEMYSTFICTCGPPAFNALAENILKTLDFSSKDMHFFSS